MSTVARTAQASLIAPDVAAAPLPGASRDAAAAAVVAAAVAIAAEAEADIAARAAETVEAAVGAAAQRAAEAAATAKALKAAAVAAAAVAARETAAQTVAAVAADPMAAVALVVAAASAAAESEAGIAAQAAVTVDAAVLAAAERAAEEAASARYRTAAAVATAAETARETATWTAYAVRTDAAEALASIRSQAGAAESSVRRHSDVGAAALAAAAVAARAIRAATSSADSTTVEAGVAAAAIVAAAVLPAGTAMSGAVMRSLDGLDSALTPLWRTAKPLAGDAGFPTSEEVLQRDLTLARLLEAALFEDTTPFRDAFAHAPIPMMLATVEGGYPGRLMQVNPALSRLTGFTEAELLQASVCDLVSPNVQDVYADSLQNPPAGSIEDYDEVRHWSHADGRPLLVRATMSPVRGLDGEARSVIGQVQDITASRGATEALRESEQRFRLAFDGSPEALLLLDLGGDVDGRVLSVNRELCRLTGYSEPELLRMEYLSTLRPHDGSAALSWMPAMQAGALSRHEADSRARHADGHTFRARVVVSLIRADADRANCALVQITDLANRRPVSN